MLRERGCVWWWSYVAHIDANTQRGTRKDSNYKKKQAKKENTTSNRISLTGRKNPLVRKCVRAGLGHRLAEGKRTT